MLSIVKFPLEHMSEIAVIIALYRILTVKMFVFMPKFRPRHDLRQDIKHDIGPESKLVIGNNISHPDGNYNI